MLVGENIDERLEVFEELGGCLKACLHVQDVCVPYTPSMPQRLRLLAGNSNGDERQNVRGMLSERR